MASTKTETAEAKSETTLRREAYAAAEKRLREENKDRFNALVQEEAEARGVTYQRRLTEAEKAEKAMSDLLAAHPELATKFGPAAPVQD